MSSSDCRQRRVKRAVTTIGAAAVLALTLQAARAAVDLAALQVTPQRGQSAEQARRDRYECHNWAVEQTGVVPPSSPAPDQTTDEDRGKRADRVSRAIAGAAIGGVLGGLFGATGDRHHHRDADNGVLAGAAVGAAVGAATAGRDKEDKPDAAKSADDDYLRALTACLEGRGYSVALPSP